MLYHREYLEGLVDGGDLEPVELSEDLQLGRVDVAVGGVRPQEHLEPLLVGQGGGRGDGGQLLSRKRKT